MNYDLAAQLSTIDGDTGIGLLNKLQDILQVVEAFIDDEVGMYVRHDCELDPQTLASCAIQEYASRRSGLRILEDTPA